MTQSKSRRRLQGEEVGENSTQISRALNRLQDAQRLIRQAGEQLSPVEGFADEWDSIRELYFDARRLWHAVDRRRDLNS